jgi:hypothetical protein
MDHHGEHNCVHGLSIKVKFSLKNMASPGNIMFFFVCAMLLSVTCFIKCCTSNFSAK